MLCLAGLLMLVGTRPSAGQSVTQVKPDFVLSEGRSLPRAGTAPASQSVAADTTLQYYDLFVPGNNGPFALNLGLNAGTGVRTSAVGTLFTAPFDGAIDRVDFELFNLGAFPGVTGTGTLRIKLIEAAFVFTDPPSQNEVASTDVDLADLTARGTISPGAFGNQIDVSEDDFEIEAGEGYFLQLSLVDPSNDAAVTVLFDGGSNDSTDTRYFPARTLVYLDSMAANTQAGDDFVRLRDPVDTTFSNLNLLFELQLSKPPTPPPPATARAQFVHNTPGLGPVDVYVGDQRVVDDLAFREATAFVEVSAGDQPIEVVHGSDADNSVPLTSNVATITANRLHWALTAGADAQSLEVLVSPTLTGGGSDQESKVSFVLVHGGIGADAIDVHVLDTTAAHTVIQTLADDLGFGAFSESVGISTLGTLNLAVSTEETVIDVFRLEVGESGGFEVSTLLLVTSGVVNGDPALALLSIDADGMVAAPPVSTNLEGASVPEHFALHGNYPNPFNPETTIRFDLGEVGFTTLQVYNLLGKEVATLLAEPLRAGSHAVVFDASGLPSGPYLYRLTSGRFTEEKMLLLVK